MRLELLDVVATDKVRLPGLLYEPEKPTHKVAVWLHGMGDSGAFYKTTLMNALGKALTDKNIAFLALNNRGAHNIKNLKIVDDTLPEEDRRYQGGTFYELIEDCVQDINGAYNLLSQKDFTEFYLLGHSTGANKICVYDSNTEQNPFSKYVLAGPGDDVGLFFQELGEKRFWQSLKYAAEHLKKNPQAVMPKYTGMHPFSVQSAWDILNPDGAYNTFPFYEASFERLGKKRLFNEYQDINLPTLVILGENDEFAPNEGGAAKARDIFMKHTSNAMLKKIDFALVPAGDHSFHNVENEFAEQVAEWLSRE